MLSEMVKLPRRTRGQPRGFQAYRLLIAFAQDRVGAIIQFGIETRQQCLDGRGRMIMLLKSLYDSVRESHTLLCALVSSAVDLAIERTNVLSDGNVGGQLSADGAGEFFNQF